MKYHITLLLILFHLMGYSQEKPKPLDLKFNGRISEPILMPYAINNGTKGGGPRWRYYFFRKDNKPYTIDQGTCSAIGQEGTPAGSFNYRMYINKNKIWVGYMYSHYFAAKEGMGILVQCIDN